MFVSGIIELVVILKKDEVNRKPKNNELCISANAMHRESDSNGS